MLLPIDQTQLERIIETNKSGSYVTIQNNGQYNSSIFWGRRGGGHKHTKTDPAGIT